MISHLVAVLAGWLAPWQSAYSGSKLLETGVVSAHLVALLFGGGLAVAADRAMLRALRTGPAARDIALNDLRAAHRPVLIALGAQFVSGVALAAADVNTFANSPVFLVKLTLVTLLCINGAVLFHTEQALGREPADGTTDRTVVGRTHRLWTRLRTTAWLSLTLWTCTVVTGIALVNAG